MPNNGIPAPSTSRVTPTMWSAVAGSPGPLDRNTPSGLRSAICSKVDRRRQHVAADAAAGEVARRVGLDAQVERGDGEPLRPIGFHDIGGVGADLARQVGTEHRRLAAHPVQQLVGVGQRVSGEHPGLHRTAAAQVPHHGAGVDARDADDALPDEFVVERAGGPPVRRPRRRVAHGVAGDPDLVAAALGVLVVPAGVADLRRGGDHDLAVIAGIGQGLLVAGHAGGEHRLAERLRRPPRTWCR